MRLFIWLAQRLPLREWYQRHLSHYYVPKNLNIWYLFGALATLLLINQLITGIWLTFGYSPTLSGAFDSVVHYVRDVPSGWLIRELHAAGASMLFAVLYLHLFRGLLYGSYQRPRELVWLLGMGLFLVLMIEAFCGYVLPWGNMSYWAAQVIMDLPTAIPGIGDDLANWLRGGESISQVTLSRLFALHVIGIPLVIAFLTLLHLTGVRHVGANNPEGIEIKKHLSPDGTPLDGIPFHPYYTIRDLLGVGVFLLVFVGIVFFFPTGGGLILEPANAIPANPLQTPAHIAPAWYLTPFYAMLRAVPDKLGGVITMAAGLALPFLLPWLDRSKVKSMRYKGRASSFMLAVMVISFIGLGILGLTPVDHAVLPFIGNQLLAQILTALYLLYFLLMPLYTKFEACREPPDRIGGAQ